MDIIDVEPIAATHQLPPPPPNDRKRDHGKANRIRKLLKDNRATDADREWLAQYMATKSRRGAKPKPASGPTVQQIDFGGGFGEIPKGTIPTAAPVNDQQAAPPPPQVTPQQPTDRYAEEKRRSRAKMLAAIAGRCNRFIWGAVLTTAHKIAPMSEEVQKELAETAPVLFALYEESAEAVFYKHQIDIPWMDEIITVGSPVTGFVALRRLSRYQIPTQVPANDAKATSADGNANGTHGRAAYAGAPKADRERPAGVGPKSYPLAS